MNSLSYVTRLSPLQARIALLVLLGVGIFIGSGAVVRAQDLTIEKVASGVDFSWTLVAAFLVFFMQAGFAFLGAGLIRSKSTVNYMTKSFLDFCITALSFWAFGFALMWGGSAAAAGLSDGNSIIGYSGFFLSGDAETDKTALYWIFQMVFAGTAATIVAGAIAERTRIHAYLAYSFIVGALIYPIYGHWVWGGGWLQTLDIGSSNVGAVDFAGSGVVHAVGGMVALAGAMAPGISDHKYVAYKYDTYGNKFQPENSSHQPRIIEYSSDIVQYHDDSSTSWGFMPTLDKIDRKLVDVLQSEARISNAEIATARDGTVGHVRADPPARKTGRRAALKVIAL